MRCESTRRLAMQKAIHPMETIMPNSVTEEQAGADDWAAAMAEQAAAPSQPNAGSPSPAPGGNPTGGLGRPKIAIKSLLQRAKGWVGELDGRGGEPMDVLVNGCLIAQGEVV